MSIYSRDCWGLDQKFICCMRPSGNITVFALVCLLRRFNRAVKAFHCMKIFHVVWISGFHFFCVWEISGGSARSENKKGSFRKSIFGGQRGKEDRRKHSMVLEDLLGFLRILAISCIVTFQFSFFWGGGVGQWREAHRASINTIPCESGQCGLLTWPLLHRPSLEQSPAWHRRLGGKIPQCPAFTVLLLLGTVSEVADHVWRWRGL